MTVAESIQAYNDSRHNQVSDDQKMKWLKSLDQQILDEVILTHELPEDLKEVDFKTWFDDWGMQKELLVGAPWEDIYIHYLDQKCAWLQNEAKRYNSTTVIFDNFLISFKGWYNRNFRPLRAKEPWMRHEWV